MGLNGISLGSLLVILLIVLLLFGSKRLRSLGEDLGVALSSFQRSFLKNQTNQRDDDSNEDAKKE